MLSLLHSYVSSYFENKVVLINRSTDCQNLILIHNIAPLTVRGSNALGIFNVLFWHDVKAP